MSRRQVLTFPGLTLIAALSLTNSVQAASAPRSLDTQARHGTAPQMTASLQFLFSEHGVYEVVAAPGRITDIVLEPGETLVETNPIAAGDTVRWVIGDTSSGEGSSRRVHVLIKPIEPRLATNLIINTSRRAYHLQLRASSRAFVSQVAWRYPPSVPAPALAVTPSPKVDLLRPPPEPTRLNFGYRLKGKAAWRPARVFDDGARTFIEFDPGVGLTDLPPLFLVGPDGQRSELVNYRVEGRRLIVDRLLARAELRFGLKRWERRVRIERLGVARAPMPATIVSTANPGEAIR